MPICGWSFLPKTGCCRRHSDVCRPVIPEGAGGLPVFCRSVNPISIGMADYALQITTFPYLLADISFGSCASFDLNKEEPAVLIRGAKQFVQNTWESSQLGRQIMPPKLLLASPTVFADAPTALCSWSCSTMIPMDFEQIVSPLWWAQQAPPCSDQMKRKIQMRCPPADKEKWVKIAAGKGAKRARLLPPSGQQAAHRGPEQPIM